MPSTDVDVQDAPDAQAEEENPADIGVFWYTDPYYPGNDIPMPEVLSLEEQNRQLVAAIQGSGSEGGGEEDLG